MTQRALQGRHYDMREILAHGGIPIATGPMDDEPIYPGQGYPADPRQDRPGGSPFGRLAKGNPLGKSSIMIYDNDSNAIQPAAVPMLTLEGDDMDACQLVITLAPPRVIALPFSSLSELDVQNLSGEQDNSEVPDTNFPGSGVPIQWPPLEAVIEWGVGGAASKATVDYANGVVLSVVASYLRVHAVVTQNADDNNIDGTSAAYWLSAFVGPGYARDNARRTIFVGTPANNAESARFAVPPFARRAWVFGNDTTSPVPALTVGTLRFWQSPSGNTCVANYFVNGNQPASFDVPQAGQYFSVVNQTGAAVRLGVIFELSLT